MIFEILTLFPEMFDSYLAASILGRAIALGRIQVRRHNIRDFATGRHRVTVCLGTACYVKGSRNILKEITSRYELEAGQTTSDRRFSLDIVRCVGCCAIGPVMTVNDKVYGRMKPAKVKTVLREHR